MSELNYARWRQSFLEYMEAERVKFDRAIFTNQNTATYTYGVTCDEEYWTNRKTPPEPDIQDVNFD